MNPWHQLPFLRFFIPVSAGIFLGINGLLYSAGLIPAMLVLVVIEWFLLSYTRKLITYPNRWVPGLLINLFLLMTGIYQGYQQYLPHRQNYYGRFVTENQKQSWIVQINGAISVKSKSTMVNGDIIYLIDNLYIKQVTGKVILYLEKSDPALKLASGDQLLVTTQLKRIPGPVVPASFDYAQFLKRKGILYQAYLKSCDWHCIKKDSSFSLTRLTWTWQQKLVGIIKEQSLDRDEEAVGCAMLLGYTEGFGQELQGAYSRAGVTHILSVSGLHVGLVFVIFNKILFFLNRGKKARIMKTMLLILLTWLYAMLTGLSPAVLRAAFMFSFLILGQSIGRKNNIINTLFASAMILVLINPVIIFDYGFELSYLAVIGIVWLEPVIYPLLYIPNKWLDKFWKLVAVTLAAQIATSPLAVYYFHQFPNWFIPANLSIIPLSTLVMYLGIGLLVTSSVPFIGSLMLLAFGFTIRTMNYLVKLTDHLPYPVIEGLYPSFCTVILLFVLTAFLTAWLATREKSWFMCAVTSLFFLFLSLNISKSDTCQRRTVFIFSYQGKDWAGVNNKQKLNLFAGESCLPDSAAILRMLKPFLLKNRIETVHWRSRSGLYPKNKTFNIAGKRPSLIWVSGKKKHSDKVIYNINNQSIIILGVNLAYKQKKMWKDSCSRLNIPVWDLKERGCFLREF